MIPFDSERGRDPAWRGRPGRRPGSESGWGGRLGATKSDVDTGSTWLEIPDEPARAEQPRRESRAAWLAAPLLLAAIAAGAAFVLRGPDGVFGIAFGLVL